MSNDIKVGDVLRRVTDSSAHFTMGNDYEVLEADRGLVQVNDDDGWRYNLSEESVRVNFTILRETPQLVRDISTIRVGSLVRVVNANPDETDPDDSGYYANGDIFEVGQTWFGGITTTQGIEMYDTEVEKVVRAGASDEPAKVDLTLGSPGISNDAVNQPNHYTQGKFETIEVIEEFTTGYEDGFVAYCVGNAVKYLARAPFKHDTPIEDLRKAARYLDYAIKRQEEIARDSD